MKIKRKWIFVSLIILFFGMAGFFGHQWSRHHVDYITASTGHPLKCTSCHLYLDQDSPLARFLDKEYVSPFNLTISKDGKYLYVIGQENNSLLVIDSKSESIINRIPVGLRPHSVILSKDGSHAYVSNQWSDNVYAISLPNGIVDDTLEVGFGPSGLVLDNANNKLYVVNTYSSDVSVVDLASGQELRRLPVGNNPTGASLSPDGESMLVLSRRSIPVEFRAPPKVRIAIISTSEQRVTAIKEPESAHIMENVDFSPDGKLALFTLIRPKNLVPAMQIENGWMMNFGIGVWNIDNDKVYQLLLDEPNEFYADPFDVKFSPDGMKAVVSHSGADFLSVIDIKKLKTILGKIDSGEISNAENDLGLSDEFVTNRIHTGSAPKGLADRKSVV